MVNIKGVTYLRILADNVPSFGYKVFEIQSGAGIEISMKTRRKLNITTGTTFGNAGTAAGSTISNSFYTITLDTTGRITSIIDKSRGNKEVVQ